MLFSEESVFACYFILKAVLRLSIITVIVPEWRETSRGYMVTRELETHAQLYLILTFFHTIYPIWGEAAVFVLFTLSCLLSDNICVRLVPHLALNTSGS